MRFGRAITVTLLTKALGICFGILTSVIIARHLGPSGRGVMAVLMALLGGAIQFGGLGLNGSIMYFVSREKENIEQICGNILFATFVMSAVIALLFFLVGELSPSILIGEMDIGYLHVFLIAIPFGFLSQFIHSIFVARQSVVEFNLLDLLSRFLFLAGFTITLVILELDTPQAALCFVAVTILGAGFYVVRLTQQVKVRFRVETNLLSRMLRYGVRGYVASLLLFLTTRINLFFINSSLGETEAGLYSVALQFMDVISLLPMTLGMLLFPRVAGDHLDRGELTAKVFRFALLVVGLLCIVILFAGEAFVLLLFGAEFLDSVAPLYWMTPAILFVSLWTILNNDLGARGIPLILLVAPAVAFALNIFMQIALLSSFGIASASIAVSLTSLTGFLLVLAYFVRTFHMRIRSLFVPTLSDFRNIKF